MIERRQLLTMSGLLGALGPDAGDGIAQQVSPQAAQDIANAIRDIRTTLAAGSSFAEIAPVRAKPLIAYHNTWAYFARRFRINFAGFIEPRPGVPPSASQLASLITLGREKNVAAIVRQPHEPPRNVEFLAGKTGARVVILASSVGAVPEARDYISLIDYNVNALKTSLR